MEWVLEIESKEPWGNYLVSSVSVSSFLKWVTPGIVFKIVNFNCCGLGTGQLEWIPVAVLLEWLVPVGLLQCWASTLQLSRHGEILRILGRVQGN